MKTQVRFTAVLVLSIGSLPAADHDAVVGPPLAITVVPLQRSPGAPPQSQPPFLLGRIDTIGGTVYDWQYNGPVYRWCVGSDQYGFHVAWMHSHDTLGGQADRNMRYQFYDYDSRSWNWIDPYFMWSGVGVFATRSGFGGLGANPATGCAVVSCHQGGVYPMVARDIASGAGIFEYCQGPNGYLWPPVAVGQSQIPHLAFVDDVSRDNLYYSRIATWCDWDSPMQVPSTPPTFPTHNVAASRVSGKVCITWAYAYDFPYVGYYRLSTNNGTNWGPVTNLGYPPAYAGDTACTYYITSLFPFYDSDDQLHIVVDVMPIFRDTVWIAPSEIWHWCPDNNPVWSRIHRAFMDPHRGYGLGYNAHFACRPSIGEDSDGNLFVAWEQFDTLNVEPRTNLLRADVWVSGSTDNGASWVPGLRITGPDAASRRFPCVIDRAIPGGSYFDTVVVVYEVDRYAGFRSGSSPVGPWSENPIVAHKLPANSILRLSPYRGAILAPDGGEVIAGGDTFNVVWTVNLRTFFYGVLSLSTDGGNTFPIVLRTSIPPAETTYRWPVPQLNASRCRVKFDAVDSSGITVFSDASNGNFTIDSDTPPAPLLVYPRPDTAINNPSVVFRWRTVPDVGGIAYYTVQVAYDSLFVACVDTARRTDTTWARLLPADTVHYWRVKATDRTSKSGPWSRAARFEIDAQVPGVPTLLEPIGDTWLRSPTVVLRWTAVQFEEKGHRLRQGSFAPVRYIRAVDTTATNIDLWVDTLSVTADTLVLPWERRYWWQVRSYDLAGNQGSVTSPASFGVDVTQPPMVTLVRPPDSGIVETDTVRLLWRAARDYASGVRWYELLLGPDTVFTETLVVTDTTRLVTLSGQAAYYWKVRAVDRAGNVGNWSPRRMFTYLTGVAENRLELGTGVRLLASVPNPFSRSTSIRLSLPCEMHVAAGVYDAAGQLVRVLAGSVLTPGVRDLVWDGRDAKGQALPCGIYFARLAAGDFRSEQKLILTR